MTIATDIKTIAAAFAKVDRIDPPGPIYTRLVALLDRADDEALTAAYNANIKFVSKLAFNRMLRRGLVKVEG